MFDPKKDKVLYLTDSYAHTVAGIKMSLLREIRYRGIQATYRNVHSAGINKIDGKDLLKTIEQGEYKHVWIVHTWVEYIGCTLRDINKSGATVLGFGLSDPYDWNPNRLKQYNLYATHSRKLADTLKNIPVCYFTTCCDTLFHKDMYINRDIDVLFIGCGIHPRFKNKKYRLTAMKRIMKKFPNTKIYGKAWPGILSGPSLKGNNFLKMVNRAKVGVDIEELFSPLAHRNFEFPACGTPIITRKREDVERLKSNFPVYENVENILSWIKRMLSDEDYYKKVKLDMFNSVRKKHSIKNRVDVLLNWLVRVP